ncbi:MAG: serine hydrolase, partial [Bacteroidota bacterium]
LVILLLFSSCKKGALSSFDTRELQGVWSGLLFQTTAKYDSIALLPVALPQKAILYQNGTDNTYDLKKIDDQLTFKGEAGLRFDATFSEDTQSLYGVITDALWSQSLQFSKAENRWVADIVKPEIIDTDYYVYLAFEEDSSGTLKANIQSNKENRVLHFTIDSVWVKGYDLYFNITNKRFAISAKFDEVKKHLLLCYGNTGGKREVILTKLPSTHTAGYRPCSKQNYTYRVPATVDASFETATLEEVGINPSMLALMPAMNSGKYEHIHSILITKENKLVFEEYFHGYNREYLHDIRSSFKSISSLLLGKAMMEDESIKINDPILHYYPEYTISDKDKQAITIHQALTMSTGLQLEDEDEMQWRNNDWVGYKLDLPMAYQPGKKYQYSSGGMNLLTGVLQKSTEKYLPLFIYEAMLLPMDIRKFQMRTSPAGRAYLPGDFYLRPLDFTKFGLLVLNKGRWNDQQLVTAEWINTSTQPHIKSSWPKNADYGYLWRLIERNVGGKPMKTIEAWGNGGQFLIIIPEAKMTVTFTGGNYNLFPEMEEKPFEILEKYILPAVEVE